MSEHHLNLKSGAISVLFILLLAACHCPQKSPGTEDDPNPQVNWLQVHEVPGWDKVTFKSNPNNRDSVENEIKMIRVYVRGWIAEYNDSVKTHDNPLRERSDYIVESFRFTEVNRTPLIYSIEAYLKPHARSRPHHDDDSTGQAHAGGTGGHILPPPPPPPGK